MSFVFDGLRRRLPEGERKRAFAGHSLRAGHASSTQIEEAHVQRHLGHASAEMTRRYQFRADTVITAPLHIQSESPSSSQRHS